MNINTDINMI